MRQILVDTNVLISYLTDREPEQQKKAEALFEQAAAGTLAIILHQVALIEMMHVLLNFYRMPREEAATILRDLLGMPGTRAPHALDWPTLFDLWPDKVPSFPDALIATAAAFGHFDAVATFDVPLARRLRRHGFKIYW